MGIDRYNCKPNVLIIVCRSTVIQSYCLNDGLLVVISKPCCCPRQLWIDTFTIVSVPTVGYCGRYPDYIVACHTYRSTPNPPHCGPQSVPILIIFRRFAGPIAYQIAYCPGYKNTLNGTQAYRCTTQHASASPNLKSSHLLVVESIRNHSCSRITTTAPDMGMLRQAGGLRRLNYVALDELEFSQQ